MAARRRRSGGTGLAGSLALCLILPAHCAAQDATLGQEQPFVASGIRLSVLEAAMLDAPPDGAMMKSRTRAEWEALYANGRPVPTDFIDATPQFWADHPSAVALCHFTTYTLFNPRYRDGRRITVLTEMEAFWLIATLRHDFGGRDAFGVISDSGVEAWLYPEDQCLPRR